MLLKKRKLIDIGFSVLFLFSFACFLFWLKENLNRSDYNSSQGLQPPQDDEFDSSLSHLNSVNKLIYYCDSFYQANLTSVTYPSVVSRTIRNRFYHGYSYYNMGDNALGVFLEPIAGNWTMAIVIPDDIAKYPYAACSQQSILGMEIFKRKGYPVRKVSMFDTLANLGHFAYEVYYQKGWHFFDTDQEPDAQVLKEYNRPSVAFLATNPDIILEAYRKRQDPQLFKRLLMSYKLGPVNKFPAPNAYLYQIVTKYATYFGWIFFLGIIITRYRLRRATNKPSVVYSAKKEESVPAFS